MSDLSANKVKANTIRTLSILAGALLLISSFFLWFSFALGSAFSTTGHWLDSALPWLMVFVAIGLFWWSKRKSRRIKEAPPLSRSAAGEFGLLGLSVLFTILTTFISGWLLSLYKPIAGGLATSGPGFLYQLSFRFDQFVSAITLPSLLLLTLGFYLALSSTYRILKKTGLVILILFLWLGCTLGAKILMDNSIPTAENRQISQQRVVDKSILPPAVIGPFQRSHVGSYGDYSHWNRAGYISLLYVSEETNRRVVVKIYKYGDDVYLDLDNINEQGRYGCGITNPADKTTEDVLPVVDDKFFMPVYFESHYLYDDKPFDQRETISVCWPWKNYAVEVDVREIESDDGGVSPAYSSIPVQRLINTLQRDYPSEIGDYNYTFSDYLRQTRKGG